MELQEDIGKTIKYAKKFGSSLNLKQLKKRLISKRVYSESSLNKKAKEMGIDHNTFENEQAKIKIEKSVMLVNFLSLNKNILFVGITGSVAFDQPDKEDDIDLMIITKANKLWTTRLWLKLWILIHKIPHRKYGKKEMGDDFCFNLWIDESALMIPKSKQNLKNGLDLINIKKVLNRDNIWEKFVLMNQWVKKELATPYWFLVKKNNYQQKKSVLIIEKISFMERLAYLIQITIIRSKKKNDLVNFNQAFFHDKVIKR